MELRDYILSGHEQGIKDRHSLHLLKEPISRLREFEQLSTLQQQELHQQITYSLLCGMIEESKINSVFQKLGKRSAPKQFCMLTVSGISEEPDKLVSSILGDCLYVEIHEDLIDGIVCLLEMISQDSDMSYRKELGDKIQEYGKKTEIKIGFSKVYSDLMLIESAHKESIRALRFLLVDQKEANSICAEEMISGGKYLFPDAMLLSRITDSLDRQEYEEAKAWCGKALSQVELNGATKENEMFARYNILQKLVEYFSEDSTDSDPELLRLCMEIDISNSSGFLSGVNELLNQASLENEQRGFVKVLHYIEENYQRYDLSHNEVAEVAQVNPGHLSRLFRNKMGTTYIEYLISVRLTKSTELLATTDLRIEEISKMVGYDNVSSFRKSFKRKYGISPAEYRLQNEE